LEEDIKDDVEEKITDLHLSTKYQVFKDYCLDYDWQKINKSYSHGDLTFENIIIRDGEIFFIDFLDSFTSSRVLDYSKLMQDIASAWSWRENTQSPFINLLLLDNILKESVSTNILTASHKMLILNLLRIIPYSSKKEEEFLYTSLLKLKQQKI
jgi:thiamine kinase-like enzyme